jgi:hypothetical protein
MLSDEKQFYIYLSQFTHEPAYLFSLSISFQIQKELSFTSAKRNCWQGHGKRLVRKQNKKIRLKIIAEICLLFQ